MVQLWYIKKAGISKNNPKYPQMIQTQNTEKSNENKQGADYIGTRRLSVAPMLDCFDI